MSCLPIPGPSPEVGPSPLDRSAGGRYSGSWKETASERSRDHERFGWKFGMPRRARQPKCGSIRRVGTAPWLLGVVDVSARLCSSEPSPPVHPRPHSALAETEVNHEEPPPFADFRSSLCRGPSSLAPDEQKGNSRRAPAAFRSVPPHPCGPTWTQGRISSAGGGTP